MIRWLFTSWRREAKRFHRRLVAQGSRLFAVELGQDQIETRLEKLESEVRAIPRPNVVAPRPAPLCVPVREDDGRHCMRCKSPRCASLTGGFCLKRTPCDEPCEHNGCEILRGIAAYEAECRTAGRVPDSAPCKHPEAKLTVTLHGTHCAACGCWLNLEGGILGHGGVCGQCNAPVWKGCACPPDEVRS